MEMVGQIKVLCTQEQTATAEVSSSCEAINVGDLIRRLEPIPIPLASEYQPTPQHCALQTDRPTGYLLYGKGKKLGMGEEDLISVDLGSDAGIVPGDFLVVFRESLAGPDYPPMVLGDAVVLLVEKATATAKILGSYIDINIGDRVVLH
jgi:hypothetical protein